MLYPCRWLCTGFRILLNTLLLIAPNTFRNEKPPPTFFHPKVSLAPSRQTSPPPSRFAKLPVSVAMAAYCLNPAGRPGVLALQMPTVPTNRPVLLELHHSHLQSSRRTKWQLDGLAFNTSSACGHYYFREIRVWSLYIEHCVIGQIRMNLKGKQKGFYTPGGKMLSWIETWTMWIKGLKFTSINLPSA